MEGRGVGTKGLDRAAEFIAAQFSQSGLKANLFAGSPYQKFAVTMSVKLGANNRLALVGPSSDPAKPQRIDLKPGEDFNPLALGGSGTFDLPLVFAGYGITGPSEHYDDYAGLDAGGKAVVILRHQPQQGDPKSVFGGTSPSQHAAFARKVANAADHKASAVVFVSDGFDIQKNVADAHKRWQDALDRLAQQHAAFKKAPTGASQCPVAQPLPRPGRCRGQKEPQTHAGANRIPTQENRRSRPPGRLVE